jgi:WD40 repeat protein
MVVFTTLVGLPNAHPDEVFCIDYSQDSKTLATGSQDHSIRLWETSTGNQKEIIHGHSARINALAFSPDGNVLASASGYFESSEPDNSVRIWNLVDFTEFRKMSRHDAEVYTVAWSPDCKFVASGSRDSTIRIWNFKDDIIQHVLSGHRGVVYDVAFSPDGLSLASGGGDKSIIIWEVCSGKQKLQPLVGHTHWVSSLLFDRSGAHLISGSWDSTIRIWSTADGSEVARIDGHSGRINSLALSPNGRMLASASGDPQSGDNAVRLWTVPDGAAAAEPLVRHAGPVYAVAFSPDGNTLASAGKDGDVYVWDVILVAARLAVGMGLHPRLGRDSPLAALDHEIVLTILNCLLQH